MFQGVLIHFNTIFHFHIQQKRRKTKEFLALAFFEIFQFLVETEKATGFKSLLVYWEVNQMVSKFQITFLNKTCKKRSKTKK